jgi:hypothetical protein
MKSNWQISNQAEPMNTTKMSEGIKYARHRAAEFGTIGSANAQSNKPAQAGLPTIKLGMSSSIRRQLVIM